MRILEREWQEPALTWLGWAILNPFGPTFQALGTRRHSTGHVVFLRSMHMTGGFTVETEPGPMLQTLGDVAGVAKRMDEFLLKERGHGLFTAAPSFVLAREDDEDLLRLFAQIFLNHKGAIDLAAEIAEVRRFGTDFFGRADSGIAAAIGREAARKGGGDTDGVDADSISWWLNEISSPEFSGLGFKTLMFMWKGAAGLVPGVSSVSETDLLSFILGSDLLPDRLRPRSDKDQESVANAGRFGRDVSQSDEDRVMTDSPFEMAMALSDEELASLEAEAGSNIASMELMRRRTLERNFPSESAVWTTGGPDLIGAPSAEALRSCLDRIAFSNSLQARGELRRVLAEQIEDIRDALAARASGEADEAVANGLTAEQIEAMRQADLHLAEFAGATRSSFDEVHQILEDRTLREMIFRGEIEAATQYATKNDLLAV